MSSRNLRLNEEEKKLASQLYKTLTHIKKNRKSENFLRLKNKGILKLEKKGFKVDYLELARSKDLRVVEDFNQSEGLIILIAAFLGNVRLIDNVLIKD